MAYYESVAEMVGNTPLLALHGIEKVFSLKASLFAKLESFNPASSAKDRIALAMILAAEASGELSKNGTIIEPTSGNTGIGLAAIGCARGYRVIIVMPDTMSVERQRLIAAYGAELVLTKGALGMAGAIAKANELKETIPGSYIPNQFENPANPAIHAKTTAKEIWEDTQGKVDVLVAGIGTGGTISGCASFLKEQKADVIAIGVEPTSSPLLSKGVAGPHGLQGIGANFVPKTLDRTLLDRVVTVDEPSAYDAVRAMARSEGILVGISSGAALSAAIQLAKTEDFAGKNIVVILPDTGERYLSTSLFTEEQP